MERTTDIEMNSQKKNGISFVDLRVDRKLRIPNSDQPIINSVKIIRESFASLNH